MRARNESLSRFCAILTAFALVGTGAAARLDAQVNREGPVQVKVTPHSLAPDAKVWEFDVAFNTHTTPIEGDPAQFSVLVDASGKTYKALAWNGDPPGGHHRKGVLQFKPLAKASGVVELRINGVGGVATRAFRWER